MGIWCSSSAKIRNKTGGNKWKLSTWITGKKKNRKEKIAIILRARTKRGKIVRERGLSLRKKRRKKEKRINMEMARSSLEFGRGEIGP